MSHPFNNYFNQWNRMETKKTAAPHCLRNISIRVRSSKGKVSVSTDRIFEPHYIAHRFRNRTTVG